MILGVEGITSGGRWRLQYIHGTSSVAWPAGHRDLAAGAQVWGSGLPQGRPPKTPGSSRVQHKRARLGKEVKVPQKKNKILDSSDHLLSPNSSSNIHPSPSRAGCRSSTRLPWPGTRASRGRGQGRAGGVAFTAVAWGASRAVGRAQSRRRDCPPPPARPPDAEAREETGNRSRSPWLSPPAARS